MDWRDADGEGLRSALLVAILYVVKDRPMAATEASRAADKVLLRDAGALLVIGPFGGIVWHDSELAEGALVWRPTATGGELVLRGARLRGETDEVVRGGRREVRILHVTQSPPAFVSSLEDGDVSGAVGHLVEAVKQVRRPPPHSLRLLLRRIRARVRRIYAAARGRPAPTYQPVIVARTSIEESEEAVSDSSQDQSTRHL